MAAPGSYIVRLTANGKSSTQPLTIKMDPRVKTPQAEMVRQLEIASKLAESLGEVSAAMQQASELRKQIGARRKESGQNAELQQALEALEKKIEFLVETDSDAEFGLFGLALPGEADPPLPKIATALSKLLTIVESADTAPTGDAATACEKWESSAPAGLGRWNELQKVDIAGTNASLQKAGFKPLKVEQAQKP